jgi:transposase InsO family protein
VNENGVAVVSDSCWPFKEQKGELVDGGIGYGLRRIISERAKTAGKMGREDLMALFRTHYEGNPDYRTMSPENSPHSLATICASETQESLIVQFRENPDFTVVWWTAGRPLRILAILDEYTREYLSLYVARQISSQGVLDRLYNLFIHRRAPEHIRSDTGPEFTAKAVPEWLGRLEVGTLFIEPGSPWENGYVESFFGKMRDELLYGEIFDTLLEARVVIEDWRQEYNQHRPHSSLGYKPPAPETRMLENLTSEVVH